MLAVCALPRPMRLLAQRGCRCWDFSTKVSTCSGGRRDRRVPTVGASWRRVWPQGDPVPPDGRRHIPTNTFKHMNRQLPKVLKTRTLDVGVAMARGPSAVPAMLDPLLNGLGINLRLVTITSTAMSLTGAVNQIPSEVLFQDGRLVSKHLGPATQDEVWKWLSQSARQWH